MRTIILLLVAFILFAGFAVAEEEAPATFDNGTIQMMLDHGKARLTVMRGEEELFQLRFSGGESFEGIARDTGIQISFDDGTQFDVEAVAHQAAVLLKPLIKNAGTEPRQLKNYEFPSIVWPEAEGTRLLGCDGLSDAEVPRASYSFLAAENPARGKGWVVGFLTHRKGSGIVFSNSDDAGIGVAGVAQYGDRTLDSGASFAGETLFVGSFDDSWAGLAAYGDAIAAENGITLSKAPPSGYCTWYSNPWGGACDERHIKRLAAFCQENLVDYGFEVIQIDDKWQDGRNRPEPFGGPRLGFYDANPKGPYRDGMEATATYIKEQGFTPGIWFIPFAADPANAFASEHPEWFVQTPNGEPWYVYWAGWCLDMTEPGARGYLTEYARRITQNWGFGYIKVDGLWSGMATKILYPTPDYREDQLGEARFHDAGATNLEAYRSGLELLRDAVGEDVFILGCNIAQNMRTLGASFGLLDGMRVGRDIGAQWDHILPCAEMGSRLQFLHGRVWYNDPDCLMLREPLTLDQARAWASWIAISGQMNLVSEWLPELPAERLDILKRSIPNHGRHTRPVDLFENNPPRIWLLPGDAESGRDVVGLFNWDEKEAHETSVALGRLGLDADASYAAFEYWSGEFLGPVHEALTRTLPPSSCAVVALCPLDRPRILSTSRHISQGAVDLLDEHWDGDAHTMTTTSKVVGGDPYEVRLSIPEAMGALSRVTCEEEGVAVEMLTTGPCARFSLSVPATREVTWVAYLD